jgi:hypothetical protein
LTWLLLFAVVILLLYWFAPVEAETELNYGCSSESCKSGEQPPEAPGKSSVADIC